MSKLSNKGSARLLLDSGYVVRQAHHPEQSRGTHHILSKQARRTNATKECIGITMGDPGGIGPEVIAKALSKPSIRRLAHFKIIGNYNIYRKYASAVYSNCSFIDLMNILPKTPRLRRANRSNAKASLSYLLRAVELLKDREISALVTAPVCKEAICLIDHSFHGHTEFLGDAFGVKNVVMMFVGDKLRTIIVTRHIPLNKVSKVLNAQMIYDAIKVTHRALVKSFKIKNPIIAVCGLNPHAGEGGNIGTEEIQKIIPAIRKAKREKITVEGPFAADTLFSPDVATQYDTIIAMYHDQGLIPVKALCFTKSVNLTIGLPFIRTSPAHGTAFDIAGKNKADPSSMCEAIKLAAHLTR